MVKNYGVLLSEKGDGFIMKGLIKYLILFVFAVLFLCFYNMFMPKNILYFIVGIPVLYWAASFILNPSLYLTIKTPPKVSFITLTFGGRNRRPLFFILSHIIPAIPCNTVLFPHTLARCVPCLYGLRQSLRVQPLLESRVQAYSEGSFSQVVLNFLRQ